MSDLKPNAQEDKDVESVSDSPGPTQEPLQSHTSSLKNNAAGNSLPSGALVNGPGSHPTSEVRCVLNKGSVLSNNVLDTEWQPEKDTSPQVLPPPSELQSDAWKNTAGLVLKTPVTQPGVNTPPSDSEENESKLPYSTLSDHSRSTALDTEQHIYSTAEKGCNEENDPEDEDNFSAKLEQLKTEQPEQDPLFFPCTICNVNFKEKRHLHRHMMYHLDRHNQVHYENVPQPFICRECGRLFCDSNSLMKHIIIHQDRLEKLMEEIKGLKKLENEDRGNTLQCPQCVFGCNCPKTFVQHAKTHDNLKHYYFCEECNYITLTQQALEAHLHAVHLNTHQPKYWRMSHTNVAEELDHAQFQCKFCSFTCGDKQILERHSELQHQQSFHDDYGKPKLADQPKTTAKQKRFGKQEFTRTSNPKVSIKEKNVNILAQHY
ncbi:zinc finger protein 644-like [Centroberyx gerrardi]